MALLGHALALRDPLRVRQAGAQVQALQQLPDPRAPRRIGGAPRWERRRGAAGSAERARRPRQAAWCWKTAAVFWKMGGGLGLIMWDLYGRLSQGYMSEWWAWFRSGGQG